LLGVIGYGMLDRSRSQNGGEPEPGGALPTLIEPTLPGVRSAAPPPGLALAPVSIVRHGDEITLDGNLPNPAAKRVLLDSVIASAGDDINIIDNLGVIPNIKALDFSAAGPVFEAAAAIPDFRLIVNGDTVTLAGTAASEDDEDAVEDAAEDAWRGVNIVNKLQISVPIAPTGAPGGGLAPDHRVETVVG
jgi:peptidoglycan-binding protein ArfA